LKRLVVAISALTLVVAACNGAASTTPPGDTTPATVAPASSATAGPADSEGAGTGAPAHIENLTIAKEGEAWNQTFESITQEFAKTHPGSTYEVQYVGTLDEAWQQVQLLAAQRGLPLMYNAPALDVMWELVEDGQAMDLEPELEKLGVLDEITPAGLSAVRTFFDGQVLALPLQLNMEGFWYNKQIFADNGLEPPATWEDLLAAAETLQAAGIQPLATSGSSGWPVTRLISGYLFRKLGPDAMARVANGEAKLTDPEYVEAAQAVADLGAEGYFGRGVTDIDYDAALDLFLQGKAGIYYMGSWVVGTFNDPERNKIGEDTIGIFPVPTVAGGVGTLTQTPTNLGATTLWNPERYDEAAGEWLKAVAENFGDLALQQQGQITGFVVHDPPADLPPLTRVVTEEIAATTEAITWFEQFFSQRGTDTSFKNVVLLVTGQMSAQDFMQSVQDTVEVE